MTAILTIDPNNNETVTNKILRTLTSSGESSALFCVANKDGSANFIGYSLEEKTPYILAIYQQDDQGQTTGMRLRFFSDGTTEAQQQFDAGKAVSPYKEFYRGGQLKIEDDPKTGIKKHILRMAFWPVKKVKIQ